MAEARLMLHCGARTATRDEVLVHRAPPDEGRWHPVAHGRVYEVVRRSLADAGYEVEAETFGLSHHDARFFGVLTLRAPIAEGVSLAVGIRNSVDKTFPLGFAAGSRVFCCDNLAFRSELLVHRKHTTHGEARFAADIAQGVAKLAGFREIEAARVTTMQSLELSPDAADAIILRAFERGIVSTLQLPAVIRQWRNPSLPEFAPRTAWSLFNSFTAVMSARAERQPHQHLVQTMQLNRLMLD
jgi:hypothetical protein